MTLEIKVNDQTISVDIDAVAASHSNIITIGKKTKEVYNAVAIESESADPFQCHIIVAGANLRLHHGQERTECPKGLMSNKLIPCNGCLGRCVNLRAGRPKYYLRTPEIPTLINGEAVGQFGTILKENDTISFGDVTIQIK